jgi:hypothetical protein
MESFSRHISGLRQLFNVETIFNKMLFAVMYNGAVIELEGTQSLQWLHQSLVHNKMMRFD